MIIILSKYVDYLSTYSIIPTARYPQTVSYHLRYFLIETNSNNLYIIRIKITKLYNLFLYIFLLIIIYSINY